MAPQAKPSDASTDMERGPAFAEEIGRLLDDGLLVADHEGMVTTANEAAIRYLGEGVVGRPLRDVVAHEDMSGDLDVSLIGAAGQEFIFQPESTVPRHFKVRVKQLQNGQIAALIMDMTLQRNLERVRRDFVANVSHELRSPLTSLAGFIETILSNDIQDRKTQIRFLRIMDEEAKRMSRLIDDLLSLSRVEVDEHILPTRTVPLIEVVTTVIDTLSDRAARSDMTIKLLDHRPDKAASAIMYGFADEITEVFHNLIENAIKYGHDGSAITLHVNAINDNSLSIAVENFGDMIAEKHLLRLTERFYRVDKARSRQIGGTGLGLAIVKHIVNRHRGALLVQSLPDGCTTFTVEVPIIGGR